MHRSTTRYRITCTHTTGDRNPKVMARTSNLLGWHASVYRRDAPHPTAHELTRLHREQMGYQLYMKLPVHFQLPEPSTTWHFCNRMTKFAREKPAQRAEVVKLLHDAHTFNVDGASRLVTLRYTRPEDRDRWAGKKVAFAHGQVTLHATDTFASPVEAGIPERDLPLLSQIDLIGNGEAAATLILETAQALAGGERVLTVRAQDARSITDFGPTLWRVVFDTHKLPQEAKNVRFIEVETATGPLHFGVFHPSDMHHLPCSRCLGPHFLKNCSFADDSESERLAKPRAPYVKKISLTQAAGRRDRELTDSQSPLPLHLADIAQFADFIGTLVPQPDRKLIDDADCQEVFSDSHEQPSPKRGTSGENALKLESIQTKAQALKRKQSKELSGTRKAREQSISKRVENVPTLSSTKVDPQQKKVYRAKSKQHTKCLQATRNLTNRRLTVDQKQE